MLMNIDDDIDYLMGDTSAPSTQSPFDISGVLNTALQTYATIETVKYQSARPQSLTRPVAAPGGLMPAYNQGQSFLPAGISPVMALAGFGLIAVLLLRK